MPKRVNKTRRHKRGGKRRTMRGGAFSQYEKNQLLNDGFIQSQIDRLDDLGVSYNEVIAKFNFIINEQYPDGISDEERELVCEQVELELMNEHMNQDDDLYQPIPHNQNDQHFMDVDDEDYGNLDLSNDVNDNSLHLSDLNNVSRESGNTSVEDLSFGFGGKKRKQKSKRNVGKKGKNTRKNKRGKRKMKGGNCYGTGVGANSYDPNLSIYNTNMLKLFPYRV